MCRGETTPPAYRQRVKRLTPGLILVAMLIAGVASAADQGRPARVILLRNEEYLPAVLRVVDDARREIKASFFLFKTTGYRDGGSDQVATHLIAAAARGVRVEIVLERENGSAAGASRDNEETAIKLKEGGVKVFFDAPFVTTHTKLMVVDGRYVLIGSHNLTNSALRYNNEISVLVDSPELAAEALDYMTRLHP
ncbi:MAG: phospholipase D-like domain-containing protein [Smithellaceae bacterium]|nr:phospholipase D-like domain-containing protein [Smithellaceae bacterium]